MLFMGLEWVLEANKWEVLKARYLALASRKESIKLLEGLERRRSILPKAEQTLRLHVPI